MSIVRLQALGSPPISQLDKAVIKIHNYYGLAEAEMMCLNDHDENKG